MAYASLFVGDPAPWFRQRCTTTQGDYTFDVTAGRYVVLYMFRSSTDPLTAAGLRVVHRHRAVFDDTHASFFGVTADAADEGDGRLKADLPGIRHFFDQNGLIGRMYGTRSQAGSDVQSRNLWFVLDPLLRVRGIFLDDAETATQIVNMVRRLPLLEGAELNTPAPVLMLPDVFEAEFCERLIKYFGQAEVRSSGVFTQRGNGPSQTVIDAGFKRRRDCNVTDRSLVEQIQARIIRRVVPEIRKVYQFEATQLERLILASYDAEERGCFGAHRDNTVRATEHRRFAVSINLNREFTGGELVFPEFNRHRYRPDAGGAMIFSCSLMHMVTPVTAGRRIACLPFVHDQAAAMIKRANRASILQEEL